MKHHAEIHHFLKSRRIYFFMMFGQFPAILKNTNAQCISDVYENKVIARLKKCAQDTPFDFLLGTPVFLLLRDLYLLNIWSTKCISFLASIKSIRGTNGHPRPR